MWTLDDKPGHGCDEFPSTDDEDEGRAVTNNSTMDNVNVNIVCKH